MSLTRTKSNDLDWKIGSMVMQEKIIKILYSGTEISVFIITKNPTNILRR